MSQSDGPPERIRTLRFFLGMGGILFFLYALVFGIPLGTETHKLKNYGSSEEGRIEGRELYHHAFVLFSIEGGLRRNYAITHELWLVGPSRGTRLKHLEKDDLSMYAVYLDKMYPVAGTDRWVAFRYASVKRYQVTLEAITFDRHKVVHTAELMGVVRDGVDLEDTCSYFLAPREGNLFFDVMTVNGPTTYDVLNNTIRASGVEPAVLQNRAQATCGCALNPS